MNAQKKQIFKNMKKYSYVELENRFKELGYQWPLFHIIGVRSKANEKNKFDDRFYLIKGPIMYEFTGTTNPGTHWLKNLLNPKGTAVLKPGQYVDAYQLGLHQGKYEALVQRKPVTVYRDGDKDDLAEEQGKEDTGLFGINIHRANPSAISNFIDKWSAGCQVLNNPEQFKILISSSKTSGRKEFTYTLLREF
jgi:hypothetical protein